MRHAWTQTQAWPREEAAAEEEEVVVLCVNVCVHDNKQRSLTPTLLRHSCPLFVGGRVSVMWPGSGSCPRLSGAPQGGAHFSTERNILETRERVVRVSRPPAPQHTPMSHTVPVWLREHCGNVFPRFCESPRTKTLGFRPVSARYLLHGEPLCCSAGPGTDPVTQHQRTDGYSNVS